MNKNADVKQAEHLQQWSDKAVLSLSASLVFGRERASEIAQPLLIALFSLTANDYEKALEIIVKIDNFSVKRIFLEQFKYTYIRNSGLEDFSALIEKVDFSNQQMSDRYDNALLRLFNENEKNTALLSRSLRALPITARRLALKRLSSKEFETFKRVKLTGKTLRKKHNLLSRDAGEPAWFWVWVLIFIVLATLGVAYI
ncbi:hypothetical protein [Candidatus Ponderosibacter sp. Uisw_141_02]|uniref:hypothetical protein n=1 Tax=Candidatus Ponderosibacter sp. Uisw_141_02 TaxID=3231000 RepID=UPI003D40BC65